MKKKLIPKVTSLFDLREKARVDSRYHALALHAAKNLGGHPINNLEDAMRWLWMNVNETDEQGVVGEVNYVRDMVEA